MPRYNEDIFKMKVTEAVKAGNTEALKALIADHSSQKGFNYTLMYMTVGESTDDVSLLNVAGNHSQIVDILLQEGLDPNKSVSIGNSVIPFYNAVKSLHLNSVKVMLNTRAKCHSKPMKAMPDGMPLSNYVDNIEMVFCLMPHLDKVVLDGLLKEEDSKKYSQTYGYQLLQQYVGGKKLEVLQQEYKDLKAFSTACQAGDVAVMRQFLEKEALWKNATLIDQNTMPMQLAADQSSVPMLKLLMEYGVDVTADDITRVDATNIEASHAFKEAYYDSLSDADILLEQCFVKPGMESFKIEYLLKRFEGRYDELIGGTSSLFHKAVGCHTLLKAMLEAGVNVDAQGVDGNTALHLAFSQNQSDSVVLLMQAEADAGLENTEGKLPLHHLVGFKPEGDIAEDDAYRGLVSYLTGDDPAIINELYCEGLSLLVQMVKARNDRCFVVAAMEGVNPNVVDANGITPLMAEIDRVPGDDQVARRALNIERIKRLRDIGCKLNFQTEEHGTVFHRAVINGDEDVVAKLFAIKDEHSLLIEYKEKTPLQLAAEKGMAGVVEAELKQARESKNVALLQSYYASLDDETLLQAFGVSEKGGNVTKGLSELDIGCLVECFKGRYDQLMGDKSALIHRVVGFPDILIPLIKAEGVNVDVQDADGNTALHLVLLQSHKQPAAYYDSLIAGLVEAKADASIRNNAGKLPLDYLVDLKEPFYYGLNEERDIKDMKALISILAPSGVADLNQAGDDGKLLLVEIAKRSFLLGAFSSLEAVDVNVVDAEGMSPLMAIVVDIAEGGEWENSDDLKDELDWLKELGFNFDLESEQHGTVFHRAVTSGNEKFVEAMFAHKTEQSLLILHQGKTPLQLAAEKGMAGVVEAELKQAREAGDAALLKVCYDTLEDNALLKRFIVKGLWQPEKYKEGLTELDADCLVARFKDTLEILWFAAYNQPMIADKILQQSPDLLNKLSKRGVTLLHQALAMGNPEVVSVLQKHSVDVKHTTDNGVLPLFYIREGVCQTPEQTEALVRYLTRNGEIDVNQFFKEEGGNDTLVNTTIKDGNMMLLRVLVEKFQVNLNISNYSGRTPLICAVQVGEDNAEDKALRLEMTQYLLENGADINVKTKQGCALHYICDEAVDKLVLDRVMPETFAIETDEDLGGYDSDSERYYTVLAQRASKTHSYCADEDDILKSIKLLQKHGALPVANSQGDFPSSFAHDGKVKKYLEAWEAQYRMEHTIKTAVSTQVAEELAGGIKATVTAQVAEALVGFQAQVAEALAGFQATVAAQQAKIKVLEAALAKQPQAAAAGIRLVGNPALETGSGDEVKKEISAIQRQRSAP